MAVVQLAPYIKGKRVLAVLNAWYDHLVDQMPQPEDLGWRPVERDEEGRTTRWFLPRYRALIGYVPGTPEYVYVDYGNRCVAFDCTIAELAVGLETGLLPEPIAEVHSPAEDE